MAKKKKTRKTRVQLGPFVTEMTPAQLEHLVWLLWRF